jgi:hypothetical protein
LCRLGNSFEAFRLQLFDDGPIRLQDHRQREAEENGAGVHEVPKQLAVRVVENLRAVEIRRHELRFAGETPALHFAIGMSDCHRVRHELLERAREPRIEPALECDRRNACHQDGRQHRHEAEEPDDSDMKACGGSPCPAVPHELLGLPRHDPEKQDNQDAIENEDPNDNVMGRKDRSSAGENQERCQSRSQSRENGHGTEPAKPVLSRFGQVALRVYVLVIQDVGPLGSGTFGQHPSMWVMHQHNTVVKLLQPSLQRA